MLRIGLTGGIGSGKSTVAEQFAARGIPIIDTDLIARELVEPDRPALREILFQFGSDLIDVTGRLDRAQLRERVFADPRERRKLEAILHPRIRTEVQKRLQALAAPYVIIVIPLLHESGQTDLVDRVLTVDLPLELQRARVHARDGLSDAQIDAVLAAQLPREARLKLTDDIIDNSAGLAELELQIEALHRRYLALAGPRG